MRILVRLEREDHWHWENAENARKTGARKTGQVRLFLENGKA